MAEHELRPADPSVKAASGRFAGLRSQTWGVLLCWGATRLLLLAGAFLPSRYVVMQNDVVLYARNAAAVLAGGVPYAEVPIEYPPGSLPFTLLPALFFPSGTPYLLVFASLMLLLDALGLWSTLRLAATADAGRSRIPLAYTIAVLAVGPIVMVRFDLLPAVCVLLAVLAAARGRPALAAAALGYGTAAKFYPGVVLPLLVIGLAPALGWGRALLRTVPSFTLALAVPTLPLLLVPGGFYDSVLQYHTERGVQVESLWANLLALLHVLGGVPAVTTFQFGAFDVISPYSSALRAMSAPATMLALVGTALLVWYRARRTGGLRGLDWAPVALLGVLAFILPTRVFSPQYLIWLAPLVAAVVPLPRARLLLPVFVATAAASQALFPFRYDELLLFGVPEVLLLTVRNLLMLVLAVLTVRVVWRTGSSAENPLPATDRADGDGPLVASAGGNVVVP